MPGPLLRNDAALSQALFAITNRVYWNPISLDAPSSSIRKYTRITPGLIF
jgi:hypothetical protein